MDTARGFIISAIRAIVTDEPRLESDIANAADNFIAGLEEAGYAITPKSEIAVNLPFDRVPQCACDPGTGNPPTKQQMMECRLRGGSCATAAVR